MAIKRARWLGVGDAMEGRFTIGAEPSEFFEILGRGIFFIFAIVLEIFIEKMGQEFLVVAESLRHLLL